MSPSWWPSGWKIGSRLKQLRLPRAEILVIAAACVLAFVITLSVLASSSAARSRRPSAQAREESRRAKQPPAFTEEDLALGAEDFLLPSLESQVLQPRYAPFRPRQGRWTAEQAAKYWVSPREIAAGMVESTNNRTIQRLFQDVP